MDKITDKDMGWKDLMTTFEVNANESAVLIGLLKGSGSHQPKNNRKGEPMTVAQLAAIHEFGSTDGTIPERSFLRSTIDASEKQIHSMLAQFTKQVVDGKIAVSLALGIIGQFVKQQMQKRITDQGPGVNGAWKPLSLATVEKKGSSQALIDTGQLLTSIQYEVVTGKSGGQE